MNEEPFEPPAFDEKDAGLLNAVLDELRGADIRLSGDGTFKAELDRNLFLASPGFRLLYCATRSGSHPEVPCGTWAGTFSCASVGECKAIVGDQPIAPKISCLFLSRSWEQGFFDRLHEFVARASSIEAGDSSFALPDGLTQLLGDLWKTFEEYRNQSSLRLSMLSEAYSDEKLAAEKAGVEIQRRLESLSRQVTEQFDSLT